MQRVLQVTSKLFRGGAEAFIMNVYRNINRERVQFDFLTFRSPREFYEDEIERLGGRIYHVPIMEGMNFLRRRSMLDSFFAEHSSYCAIHGHMAALGGDYLAAAERAGIQRRFSHSHIADFERNPRGYLKHAFERGFGDHATHRLACSTSAGKYMYGDAPFVVVNNGIDIERFSFSPSSRASFRASIGASEREPLIGHVGRFELMKNHDFLIEIFASMVRNGLPGRLVLAGDGSLRRKMEEKVSLLGIDDRVVFLGVIEDMPSFYSGIDVFVMPSLFEGLPFSVIEAQCSGLPCVLSDTISSECKVAKDVQFLPLSAGDDAWGASVKRFLQVAKDNRDGSSFVRAAGYDIADVARVLEGLYGGKK